MKTVQRSYLYRFCRHYELQYRRVLHTLVCIISFTVSTTFGSPYTPGEPGAEWSTEELLIVKAKLYAIFDRGNLHRGQNVTWRETPSAPKMLRLGFHDCLK